MSFLDPSQQELFNATTAAPGTTQLTPDNWYDGLPKGVLQGVAGAGASFGQMLMDIGQASPTNNSRAAAFGRMTTTSFNNFKDAPPQARSELSKTIQSTLDDIHNWAKIDPRTQGFGAQMASGLTRGLTLGGAGFAAGGPVGAAALMGSTEADTAYHDAKAQGLDDGTAYQMAALSGVTNAASAFLPMAVGGAGLKGLAQSVLSGAGINVTVGAANRLATSMLLYENGYKDMAAQYQVTDATAMAADALLGAAFGGLGHFGKVQDPTQIHDATEVLKGEHIDRSGPGIPATPDAATAHMDAMHEAVAAVDRGVLPNIDEATAHTLANETIADPAIEQTRKAGVNQLDLDDPGVKEFVQPVDVPELPYAPPPEPVAEAAKPTEAPKPAAAESTPAGPALSSQATESLAQLVKSHPDMEIQLDDGRTVRVSELPDLFEQQANDARRLAALHDVAAACFLGTE